LQKRLWLAARMTGSRSLGEVFGAHYQSTSIRIYVLVVLFLFAVPFAATLLGSAGELLAQASEGAFSPAAAISALAAFLFLASALGGWRATIYIIAVLSTVILALLIFSASFAGLVFDGLSVFHKGFSVREGILGNVLPGVIQFSSGIGREVPAGGLWTTTFSQVWIVSGLAAGALLLLGPIVGGEMNAADNFTLLVARFAAYDQLVAACVTVMLIVMLLVAVAFFAASGASVATIELLDRYVVPDLTSRGERLAARVSLAIIYAAIVLLAAFLPALATVLSTLALPLSAQLFAAYLGLCWLRWMSRSAVLVGLAFGILFVVFTEPPGLIVFDGLFCTIAVGPLASHHTLCRVGSRHQRWRQPTCRDLHTPRRGARASERVAWELPA
jgi:SSS family solute:Na+ symporter